MEYTVGFGIARRSAVPAVSPSGGGGGSSTPDTGSLAALSAEAQKALDKLQLAIGGINEKVKVGLLTTAEGVDAVDKAHRSAADSIADLIPQIEKVGGPASVASVSRLRGVLTGLVADIKSAGSELGKGLSNGFESAFESFLAGTKSGQDAFNDFTNSILANLAKIAAQRFTDRIVSPLFDGLIDIIGGGIGGLFGGAGARQSGAAGKARPSFIDSPGRIGALTSRAGAPSARAAGSAGPVAGNQIVNIQTPAGHEPKVEHRSEGNTRIMEVMFQQVKGAMMNDLARGGDLSSAMQSTFGLQRTTR